MTQSIVRSRPARTAAVRAAVLLASTTVLVAPTLVGPSTTAVAAPEVAICAEGTADPHDAFAHDTLTVTPQVREKVAWDLAAETGSLRARAARTGADPLPAEITVPVWIHVIQGKRKRDRQVTRKQARQVFYVLRSGFNGAQDPTMVPTGIRFVFRPISVSRNDRWFHARPGGKADRQMHRKLHRGSRQALNIYLNDVSLDGGALLGIARFPWLAGAYPLLDGITINVASLPGGKARGYNLGDTVIHEAGHWFGLLHTFDGGCEGPGDHAEDTAPEAEPSFECELLRDTCPSERPVDWVEGEPEPEPVPDPVQNFMDYSYDRCMNHFTPDQRTRAVTLFMRYRYGR